VFFVFFVFFVACKRRYGAKIKCDKLPVTIEIDLAQKMHVSTITVSATQACERW